MKSSPRSIALAVSGIVAGLSGCSETPLHANVPAAPSEDPAGVPAPRAARPGVSSEGGGKMSCGAMKHDGDADSEKMSCRAMEKPAEDEAQPPAKMSCAGMNMKPQAGGDKKLEQPKD